MCSSRGTLGLTVLLLAGPLAVLDVAAGEAPGNTLRLEAVPATCVALHRGQTCYQRVTLAWSPPGPGRWCLRLDGLTEPLACWQDDAQRSWSHGYASADRQVYRLTTGDRVPRERARVTVRTAWVYRGSRRGPSGWRLF